jgi:WD40 repeat protein
MRTVLTVVVLALGTFALVTYYVKPFQDDADLHTASTGGGGLTESGTPVVRTPATDEQTPGAFVWNQRSDGPANPEDLIVVPNARMQPVDRQEVPSERDGQLLVIGTEVGNGEVVPDDRHFVVNVGYMQVWDGTAWRRWREGDQVLPRLVRLERVRKDYKRLEVGDQVKANQTVALVDPVLALGELQIKIAALEAAESEARASKKTKEEAERRVSAMESSMQRVPGSVSKDDYEGARLTAERYRQEEIAKNSAITKTQQELIQANTILTKHEIHATISGDIKVIYKNRGDAVKNLEPVLQIQNRERLRVDGLVDVQDTVRIKPGQTEVIVEPTQPIRPKLQLEGHLGSVTCVAVSRGADPTILSGGEDWTLRGWNATTGAQLWSLGHRSAVRSVACTGTGSKRSLAADGCTDGSVRLIDLDRLDEFAKGKIKEQPEPTLVKGRHHGAVHCVAFSPDGTVCASGGEDRKIMLWNTETGEQLYELPPCHRASVTSLQFTPRHQLVSAGRDNLLVVWSVEAGKPPFQVTQFDRRGGDVAQLGASPDGKQVLFDQAFEQGNEIRLLSVDTHQPEGVFRNASGAANFTTMALFDPDGLTVLTNGGGEGREGRLQLWRTPTRATARAAELRQLVWTLGPATSGGFSPDGAICVTGMQDGHVLVWSMPERTRDATGRAALVETPIRSRIKKVEEYLDSSNRQMRVWVELENKDNRLVPGGTATMVILPDSK